MLPFQCQFIHPFGRNQRSFAHRNTWWLPQVCSRTVGRLEPIASDQSATGSHLMVCGLIKVANFSLWEIISKINHKKQHEQLASVHVASIVGQQSWLVHDPWPCHERLSPKISGYLATSGAYYTTTCHSKNCMCLPSWATRHWRNGSAVSTPKLDHTLLIRWWIHTV